MKHEAISVDNAEAFKESVLDVIQWTEDACTRVAERLNGRGWKMTHFDADVKIFGSIKWSCRVKIETELCRETNKQKLEELLEIFRTLDLKASLHEFSTEQKSSVTRRKYVMDYDHSRVFNGYIHSWVLTFTPMDALDISVLTEEEVV